MKKTILAALVAAPCCFGITGSMGMEDEATRTLETTGQYQSLERKTECNASAKSPSLWEKELAEKGRRIPSDTLTIIDEDRPRTSDVTTMRIESGDIHDGVMDRVIYVVLGHPQQ